MSAAPAIIPLVPVRQSHPARPWARVVACSQENFGGDFFFFLRDGCFVVSVLIVDFFKKNVFICFSLPVRARPFVPDRMILGRVEAKGVCLFAPPAGWFPVTRGDNTVSRTVWEWEERRTQKMSSSASCRSIRRPVHPLRAARPRGRAGKVPWPFWAVTGLGARGGGAGGTKFDLQPWPSGLVRPAAGRSGSREGGEGGGEPGCFPWKPCSWPGRCHPRGGGVARRCQGSVSSAGRAPAAPGCREPRAGRSRDGIAAGGGGGG